MACLRRALAVAVGVLGVVPALAGGQVLSGRVTNAAGVPIADVRILVRPVGDRTDAGRAVFSNARGEFSVRLQSAAMYQVDVRRIGFRAESTRVVDLKAAESVRLDVVLTASTLSLPTVRVTTGTVCVDVEDRSQSAAVRDWIRHAQDLIRTRRAVEQEFSYRVTVDRIEWPDEKRPRVFTYHQTPGARAPWEDAAAAALPTGSVSSSGTAISWQLPLEGTLLSPTFLERLCFDNRPASSPGGFALRFQEKTVTAGRMVIDGWLRFTTRGNMLASVEYRYRNAGKEIGAAQIRFTPISIEGRSFPIISQRSQVMRYPSGRDLFRAEERFQYSEFTRSLQPPPSPTGR